MGVRILSDKYDEIASLYCSTSDWSFGPIFYNDGIINASEFADAFLKWLPEDPRTYRDDELEKKYHEFRSFNWKHCPQCCAELIPEKHRACDACLFIYDEEERCKPISPIKITKEWDEDSLECPISVCPKCLCMTHTLRDNICGKCKEEKTK